ncbi:MAG: leucine-rich repeat protein, partial [Clostridia bacterium]|nr:leucine-rich repeat protein [Clostridia bacterium]
MKNSLYYRIISIVLVMVLVVSFIPIGTFAANTPTTGSCGENVTYFFNNSNGTLTISGTGDMKDYSMYDESPFEGNEAIKQVNIASGITKIGSYSFWCSGLTNIVIPNTVVKIGQSAFDGCRSLESINIPNSVNYIGKEAFSSTGLKRIELPNGISSIQRYLCDMCTSLTEVIIPSSVTSIGYAAFAECTSLESIDIPDSVTYIADQVFDGCTGLKTVTIPESVVSIGYGAFWNCSNLSNITIRNYNCEISDSSDTISSTAKICSHANSTAKAYADKYSRSFSSTLCDEYYVEVERVEPGFNKAGYEKRTCTVCGHSEKEDLIYYKTDENATRFASQEYILPVAKSCVYNNTLYARFDKPIAAFSGKFSSQYFRFGELTDNGTFQTYKALVLGAPRAWYILGGTRSGSNWVHQYSGGTIDSSLLHWASGEPNNDGGSENQISIDKNGYLNDSSATYNTTSMGFIIGTNLDSLKPTKENNFGTNKYAYYNTVYPFSYAQAFCEAKGGYLASISSDAENNFVFDLVDNKKEVFIGGIRNAQGNFEWVNGESFTYQKWSSGEPNNGGGKGQYYTHLYLDKGWDDINDLNDSKSAAVKNGFICEYEPSRIYAKLAQDNVHGITDEEVRIFAEYPDKTTADITAACDIDYHYNKGNVVVHATATKPNGEEIEVTNSLAVNKGNHRFEEGETTPATCTQVGQSTVICSICGKVVATSIPATGHKFSEETVAATCTQSGYKKLTCSVCGYEENTAFEALGHSYGAAQIIAPTATKRGYSAISCKRCGETYYDNYTLPACEDLPLVGLNAKKEISLSAEDEFAAVRFHSDKTAAQYILKKSANCGATPIKVLDENYRELARSNENCFCFSFEAGKDYILMSDYEANRAASGSISLVVIENSTQMAQGDLVLNMNIETNTLRISGSGNISDLAAAALYCDLVNTVVIDAAIDSVQTQAFAQFAHLSAIQFKGSNTEIVGVAAALHHATILSYTDSLAQAYAQTGSLPFSAVSGYTYTFDADGGIINGKSIYKISNKLINDNLLNELVPTDSARKFVGWALENNPEAVLTALPDVQADTHFIAVWNNDSNNVFADALTATAGEQITIPVKIENNAGFMGCNFIIDYNKNNLLPVSVDSGDVLTTGLEDNITGNAVPGQMNVYWAGKQNVYDDGVLFYITFRVKNAATGSDEIAISYSQEDTFDEQFHDVVFDCRNIALTYSNSVLPTLPQLELEADQNAPIYVGEAFAVNIRISNANVITDEQFAFDYDYTKFEIVEFAAAEGVQAQVDNDVLQLTALPAGATQIGQIVFRPLTSAATGENSIAIQGNEGESILGGNFTFTVSETVASKQITVSGSTAAFDKDGNFKVKVNFANNGGIMGYKLKFYYDAAVIKPVSAAKGDNFRSGDLTTNIGSKEGEFVVVWHDAQNAFGDGEAFTIDFKRITDDPVETAITASYSPKDTFNENWEDVELVTEDIPVSIQEVSPLINIYGADDAGNLSATAGETVTVPIYIKDNP